MSLNIAVAGATGALGKDVVEALAASPLAVAELIPVASAATTEVEVSFRGKLFTLRELSADALESADVVFACTPPGVGAELYAELAEAGCLVVDLAGVFRADPRVPVLALGLNPIEMEAVREAGAFIAPGPVTLALAALAVPLYELGVVGIRGTAMIGASAYGQKGIRELSGQVAALFNSVTPPRAVFEEGLAFDLVPGGDDWTTQELQTAATTGRVLGLDARRVDVTQVLAPLFLGLGVSAHLVTERPVMADAAKAAYEGGRGVTLERGRGLQPRTRTGEPGISVGRIRTDHMGLGLHVWAAADPLRLTAVNAVASLVDLVDGELI
ncbi:MAG: hypothetical protein GY884_03375 [Proteobacteria bacterium]|nr:hypothetical protein [Pseudomonadota bacterium]